MIKVVKRGEKQVVGAVRFSIGRASSKTGPGCVPAHGLANPFKLKPYGTYTSEESVAEYECWLEQKIASKDKAVCDTLNEIWKAAKQGEVELECFCAPLLCHGDVVKQVVEEKLKEKYASVQQTNGR